MLMPFNYEGLTQPMVMFDVFINVVFGTVFMFALSV